LAANPASWLVTADAASVLSSAVPIEPPICCIVFTIAEATPASLGSTPKVAVAIAALKTSPRPKPMIMIPGRTWLTYAVPTPTPVSVSRPTEANSMPPPISGRGPIREESLPAIGAISITISVIGRVRTPASIAE